MLTITKIFREIPFAHRQHLHEGHCRFVHGHNWDFEITFGARTLDSNGFILDFGGMRMKAIREWLENTFDHKLVLSQYDPRRNELVGPLVDITFVPDCSCEGLAFYVFEKVNAMVSEDGRAFVTQVTVRENSRASATYRP